MFHKPYQHCGAPCVCCAYHMSWGEGDLRARGWSTHHSSEYIRTHPCCETEATRGKGRNGEK